METEFLASFERDRIYDTRQDLILIRSIWMDRRFATHHPTNQSPDHQQDIAPTGRGDRYWCDQYSDGSC